MDEVVRHIKDKGDIAFPVYAIKEAIDKGIEFKHWKDCRPGEWGSSDDGFVSLCLTRKRVNAKRVHDKRSRYIIGMVFGTNFVTPNSYIAYLERRATNSFQRCSPKSSDAVEAARGRTKKAVVIAAKNMIQTGQIDYEEVGQVYRPDQAVPSATAKRLFKSERVQIMLRKEVHDALIESEIDEKLIVERFNDLYVKGLEGNNLPIAMKSTENLSKILQMDTAPTTKHTAQTEERSLSNMKNRIDVEERSYTETITRTD